MRDAEHEDGRQDVVVPRQTVAARPLPADENGQAGGDGRVGDPTTDEFPVQQKAPAHAVDPRPAGEHANMPEQRNAHERERRVEHKQEQHAGEHGREQENGHAPQRENGHAPQHRAGDGVAREDGQHAELFPGDTVNRLRTRWRELQADFVDDPRRAVRGADEVVDEVLRTITEHRQRLAGAWQGDADTERLRLAMREYRAFVDRLLPTT